MWTLASYGKLLRYSTRCQGISQFYLHTHYTGMNHAFALLAEAGPHFTDPGGMEAYIY